jgi:DNA-binding GntR family transcriptional regulator
LTVATGSIDGGRAATEGGIQVAARALEADGTDGAIRRTRADALKDAIAEAILKGELAAGQRLDEMSVAQRFAVSRTPVREALKQLAAMDLVELRPHRGAVVAGLHPARLAELISATRVIQTASPSLAPSRGSRASTRRAGVSAPAS